MDDWQAITWWEGCEDCLWIGSGVLAIPGERHARFIVGSFTGGLTEEEPTQEESTDWTPPDSRSSLGFAESNPRDLSATSATQRG